MFFFIILGSKFFHLFFLVLWAQQFTYYFMLSHSFLFYTMFFNLVISDSFFRLSLSLLELSSPVCFNTVNILSTVTLYCLSYSSSFWMNKQDFLDFCLLIQAKSFILLLSLVQDECLVWIQFNVHGFHL